MKVHILQWTQDPNYGGSTLCTFSIDHPYLAFQASSDLDNVTCEECVRIYITRLATSKALSTGQLI